MKTKYIFAPTFILIFTLTLLHRQSESPHILLDPQVQPNRILKETASQIVSNVCSNDINIQDLNQDQLDTAKRERKEYTNVFGKPLGSDLVENQKVSNPSDLTVGLFL